MELVQELYSKSAKKILQESMAISEKNPINFYKFLEIVKIFWEMIKTFLTKISGMMQYPTLHPVIANAFEKLLT